MKKYRITAMYMDEHNKEYTEVLEKEIGDQENIADYIPPKMPLIVEMWNNKYHIDKMDFLHSKAYYEEKAREIIESEKNASKEDAPKKTFEYDPEKRFKKILQDLLDGVSKKYLTITTRLLE